MVNLTGFLHSYLFSSLAIIGFCEDGSKTRHSDAISHISTVSCKTESDPMRKMACIITEKSPLDAGSWISVGGEEMLRNSLGLETNEKWSYFKSSLILASQIVESLPTRSAQISFIASTYMHVYTVANQVALVDRITSEYPRDKDYRLLAPSIQMEQLIRAPMWRLDIVAPVLLENNVRRIWIHHQLVRKLYSKGKKVYLFKIEKDFEQSVRRNILRMSISQFRRCALVGSFVSAWTQRYMAEAMQDLFTMVEDHGQILSLNPLVDLQSSYQKFRAIGRVLGLMFVRGIRMKRVRFTPLFYEVLTSNTSPDALKANLKSVGAFTIIKTEFWKVVELPFKIDPEEMQSMLSL